MAQNTGNRTMSKKGLSPGQKPHVNQRDHVVKNHDGQIHERDQLKGAYAGTQNESNSGKHGTKEKVRRQHGHDTGEDIIDDDGGII